MPFWHFLRPPFVTNAKTAFVMTRGDDRVNRCSTGANTLSFIFASSSSQSRYLICFNMDPHYVFIQAAISFVTLNSFFDAVARAYTTFHCWIIVTCNYGNYGISKIIKWLYDHLVYSFSFHWFRGAIMIFWHSWSTNTFVHSAWAHILQHFDIHL